MHRLGYTRYVAQGGDLGAIVTDVMGRQAPEGLLGIHMNLLVTTLGRPAPPPGESEEERAALDADQDVQRRAASATSWSSPRGRRRSATPCWIHPSPWRPGCSTTTRTATTRSPRAFVDGQPAGGLTRGPHPRQHHAVLADGHRGFGGPVVLGARTSRKPLRPARLLRRSRSRSASPRSRRDLPGPAQLGREVVPQPHLLQRGRQGRPLRRLGGAGALLAGGPGCVQVAALIRDWAARTKGARRSRSVFALSRHPLLADYLHRQPFAWASVRECH